jgi:ATP-dependent Clp protease ATP-binding subunit ClpA
MPLAGGPADKFGNRYEHWWTVSQLVQMLHGEAESIRIEDPGVAKAEFVLTKNGKRELHQAKRSHPDGKWSLSSLSAGDTEILQSIFAQLSGNDARFIFVSSSDARELAELAERAIHAESVTEFETRFVGTKKESAALAKLRKIWKDTDVRNAYDILRRIEVRTIDEKSLEERVRFGLSALFLTDADPIIQALWKIADDSIHKTVGRDELIASLEKQGFRLRRLANAAAAPALIAQITDRYLNSARKKLIQKTIIPRSATQSLLKRLQESRGSDNVLTGTAGGGKTGCVIELVDELRKRKVPVAVLAFRLDRLRPVSNTAELGQQLGLEESPALVLAAAATNGEAVLIVDQLDAVSTASGRNSDFFDAVEGLLNEARGLRDQLNLHVLVVCREFDWQNDHRLCRLLSDQHVKVEVGEFSPDEVRTVLEGKGFRMDLFYPAQLRLLRLPQNLSLFLEAGFYPSKSPRFNSAKELFDRYWNEKRRAVAARTTPLPVS